MSARVKKAVTSVYDLGRRDLAAQVDLAARTAAPIFRFFGWTWRGLHVPNELDIRNDIDEKLCELLSNKGLDGVNSGRIDVCRHEAEPTGFAILLDLT